MPSFSLRTNYISQMDLSFRPCALVLFSSATQFISKSSFWNLVSEEIKMHMCSGLCVVGVYKVVFLDVFGNGGGGVSWARKKRGMQEDKATGSTGKWEKEGQLTCCDQNTILLKEFTIYCLIALMVRRILLGYLYPLSQVLPPRTIKNKVLVQQDDFSNSELRLCLSQFWGAEGGVHNPKTSIVKMIIMINIHSVIVLTKSHTAVISKQCLLNNPGIKYQLNRIFWNSC